MTTQIKSAVNPDLVLAARKGLIPVQERGWLGGFSNLLGKEFGQWWGTKTWWVQTIIWVLILNGITTITMLTEYMPPEELMPEVVNAFMSLSIGAVSIGIVATAQGAVVGEKQLGTVAWVMSKPASRSAFILAKIIAYSIGFWVTALLIPATIMIIAMRAFLPMPPDLKLFLSALPVVALGQLFYLTLTLMLGTFFNSRGPITGIGIAFIMTGLLLKGFIPIQLMILTPWLLPDVATGVALGTPLPSFWFVPVLATAIWIVLMITVALWRFSREEF